MSLFTRRIAKAALAASALVLGAMPLQATAVTITTNAIVSEASVLNNGNVLLAANFGPGAPAVVNGINFNANNGINAAFSGFSPCGGDFSNHFAPGSGLDRILSGCAFQAGGTGSLTLSNLDVGTEYTVQMLWANTLNTTGRNSRISTGGQTVDFNFGAGTPRNIMTTFTATATTQLFDLGTGNPAENQRFQMNALVVSGPAIQASAPATMALLGLGLLAAGARRRRA